MRRRSVVGVLCWAIGVALGCTTCSTQVNEPTAEAPDVVGTWITASPVRIVLTLRADGTFDYQERLLGSMTEYMLRQGTYEVDVARDHIRMTTTARSTGPLGTKMATTYQDERLPLEISDEGFLTIGDLTFEAFDPEGDDSEVWGLME